jgi:glucosamine-6-phosphate deaminase
VRTLRVDALAVRVHDELDALASDAADLAEAAIVDAVRDRGHANVMFASGNSQLAFLSLLVTRPSIDWPRVVAFHMDEYVGVGAAHPASFARYMRERIASLAPVGEFNYLQGDAPDPQAEATRYASLLAVHPLDLCCLGIGENGHLAFNDPPPGGADFDDPVAAKIVTLDERCKAQQVGEGHFATIADVPPTAITVTIPGLLGARSVLAIVPEARKAAAVHAALIGPITPACPASALRRTDHATLLLDRDSAQLLS